MSGPAATDPHDERALMGFTAGILWLVAALTTGVAALLPGAPQGVDWMFVLLEVLVIGYSLACIFRVIRWERVSLRGHALTTAALLPLIGVTMWATGGTNSYVYPLVLFPLLHIAYFFPLRMSVPLVVELTLIYASPLLYAEHPTAHAFPGRALAFAVGAAVLMMVVRSLKARLVNAERSQREMAHTDALTGLANRRAFDEALAAAVAGADTALVIFDIDDFKGINDEYGHARGDDVLRTVAGFCQTVAGPDDTLARIGGDEFALIAPLAGEMGALLLAEELTAAIQCAGAEATVGWAVHPQDGADPDTLLRTADRRLYAAKPAARTAPAHLAATA